MSVVRQDGKVIYLVGTQGLFCHDENDHRSFRLYTAQLIDQDACRQIDVARAFGVTKSSLARALKTLRAGGAEAFYTNIQGSADSAAPRRFLRVVVRAVPR